MVKVIYYSRGSLIPALLCAEKHRRPASTLRDTLRQVQQWLSLHREDTRTVTLLPYEGGSAEALYVMTAAAPPGLVERTLSNLYSLLGDRGAPEPLILVSSLPFSRSGSAARQEKLIRSPEMLRKLWPEIEAAVQQARLQIALLEKYQP